MFWHDGKIANPLSSYYLVWSCALMWYCTMVLTRRHFFHTRLQKETNGLLLDELWKGQTLRPLFIVLCIWQAGAWCRHRANTLTAGWDIILLHYSNFRSIRQDTVILWSTLAMAIFFTQENFVLAFPLIAVCTVYVSYSTMISILLDPSVQSIWSDPFRYCVTVSPLILSL